MNACQKRICFNTLRGGQVMLSFDGKDFFGNLTYEYARRQRVLDVLPFPAWRWDESTNVTLVGSGLSWPVYCRWLDLTITQALEVSTIDLAW